MSPLQRTAVEIEKGVAQLFAVHDVTLGIQEQPEAIRLRGHLQVASHQAYPQIADLLRGMGYTAVLTRDPESGLDTLLAMPGVMPKESTTRPWLNVLLYVLTILSTLFVGASLSDQVPPGANELWLLGHLWIGWPFALSLMAILTGHELGHYFSGRHYQVPVSLPFFIPMPLPPLGTMGAVIVMKGRIASRRVMLDIGAAGPLVGLAIAIPVLILGLSLSHVEPLPVNQVYSMEGNSLLYLLLKYAVFGRWLPADGVDVFIHPVAFAGWAGLLVTSLNLIPVGQLDGGHVLYSLLGNRARLLTWPIIAILAVLGLLVWPGWFLWAGLVFLFGQRHPGPLDTITELDPKRKALAVLVMVVFVLTFTPLPLAFVFPEGSEGLSAQGPIFLAATVTGLAWLRRSLKVWRPGS